MVLFIRNLIILVLALGFLGCESKKTYDIQSDPMLKDLDTRVKELEEDLNTLVTELKAVQKVLDDNSNDELDFELRNSLKKEIIEGEVHQKNINQWLSYLKIQRKQRFQSLYARKEQESLSDEAKKESEEYFLQKKLKPIEKPWLDRHRTAIEL